MSSSSSNYLCLNMIVKNEAHIIEETLNNLTNNINIDYWVICDTGSTDNTKDIIKNFFDNKKIKGELIDVPWRDFGYNRTKALEYAYNKSDYLLIFDADDKIHGKIDIPKNLRDQNSFRFGSNSFSYYRTLLINNRKKWKFNGVLHEYLTPIDIIDENTLNIEGSYYIESGRTGNRSLNKDKYKNDAEILEKAFEKERCSEMKTKKILNAVRNKHELIH